MILRVDNENNAETFWDAASDQVGTFEAPIQTLMRTGELVCTDEEGEYLLERFRSLPGWTDESAPSYAPHPVVVVEA